MQIPTPNVMEARLSQLERAIPKLDETLLPGPPGSGEPVQAAVSLVVRAGPELEILLIRRAEADGDPWSGHMALPGGRRDSRDRSLLRTAIRETLEETGVPLATLGAPLGRLDAISPRTRRLPPILIFPFVFGVLQGVRATTASPEVDEVLWTPVSHLHSPRASGTVDIPLGESTRTFPCLRIDGRVIWGLTYRILQEFFRQVEATSPEILRGDGNA